jgi:small-conductance mechanosensitive channel
MKELIAQYITEWGWLTSMAIVAFVFKDLVSNFVIGIQFLWGNDFNVDDIVYIKGSKKARIVRQNIWKTTFYVLCHDRKFIVPNNMLWRLEIEKEIPTQNETH